MTRQMALAARLAALAIGGLGLAGCGGDGAPPVPGARQIHLAHVLTDKHPVHQAMVRMAALLKEKTGGQLTVDIRHSAQLGGEKELVEKVQAGSVEMTKVSSNALESNVPDLGILTLPFLFRDEDHYWKVLDGPIGQELLDKLQRAGLKGLTWYDAGARSFYSRAPITGLESLRGLKIRVQESPTMIETMRALGALPQGIKFGPELTQQLEKGERVTAAENNPPSYWTEGHYKICPYYYLDEHSRPADVLVMNLKAWQSLAPEEQAALAEAARESSRYERKIWAEECERLYGRLEAEGVRITRHVDAAPFVKAVQPVYDHLSPERKAWVERIRAEP